MNQEVGGGEKGRGKQLGVLETIKLKHEYIKGSGVGARASRYKGGIGIGISTKVQYECCKMYITVTSANDEKCSFKLF